MTDHAERPRPRVYLITPPALEPAGFVPKLEQAFAGGDIACVQLRLKDAADDAVLAAARALMPVAHAHGAAFLINDRADLAQQAAADGVHLGQQDGDIAEARRLLGHDRDIGATCHDSLDLAFEAGNAGADYVAFGAFYPTATKEPPTQADPAILSRWQEIAELPSVAIGGITAENCGELVRAGADFIAVCGYVWDHPEGPDAAIRGLNAAIDAAFN